MLFQVDNTSYYISPGGALTSPFTEPKYKTKHFLQSCTFNIFHTKNNGDL